MTIDEAKKIIDVFRVVQDGQNFYHPCGALIATAPRWVYDPLPHDSVKAAVKSREWFISHPRQQGARVEFTDFE